MERNFSSRIEPVHLDSKSSKFERGPANFVNRMIRPYIAPLSTNHSE